MEGDLRKRQRHQIFNWSFETKTTTNDRHEIHSVNTGYRHALRENRIVFQNDRLLLFMTTSSTTKFLYLIIVPQSLQQYVFFAYHSSGTGAHMKSFKTLLLIRMRFFWPGMRKAIITWIKSCTGCIPAGIRNRESSGLNHSWPMTVSFAILSVDIRKSGIVRNADGYIALLNAMCDMTQFIVMSPVKSSSAHILRGYLWSLSF